MAKVMSSLGRIGCIFGKMLPLYQDADREVAYHSAQLIQIRCLLSLQFRSVLLLADSKNIQPDSWVRSVRIHLCREGRYRRLVIESLSPGKK